MNLRRFIQLLFIVALVSSCATPNVSYMSDAQSGQTLAIKHNLEITVQPEDRISVIVNSKDPLLTSLFNLPYVTQRIGQGATVNGSLSNSQGVSGYTVDEKGDIDFPVVGKIHVAGLNRSEIAAHVKHELISKNLVKDPVVTVEFMNLSVAVLGEVNKPGRFYIDKDHYTLFDAISMAGDLTIHGKRDNVLVQREENGKRVSYRVNLNSGEDLSNSPVYNLQQNDIVYVEPNQMRARQSTVNANNVRSTSFWFSLASLLTTIVVLIVK